MQESSAARLSKTLSSSVAAELAALRNSATRSSIARGFAAASFGWGFFRASGP
ncbi:hypothetical protein [Aquisphaera insulae]|uniref:hypothetical protein n=1 Tax=Aquisphaera insulae TaxID=2712864 RepID=UPI0013ED9F92|nr:hypothetical protein [Aquisphaera insulae]